MLYLPLGKALIAVQSKIKCNFECTEDEYNCPIDCCKGCVFNEENKKYSDGECDMCCSPNSRKDKKMVIYKIVNYKGKNKKNCSVKK